MFEIKKQDADKQYIFGWANVAINKSGEQLVDHQGDMIDAEDLEEAAYEHVLEFRETGERHDPALRSKGRLIESVMFTKEKMEAMGIPEGTVPQGWWVGYKVEDPETWAKVKSGEYRMFSIDGTGKREALEKSDEADDGEQQSVTKAQFFKDLVAKFNPYHDKLGRFTWAGSGGVTFATIHTKDKAKQHWADKAQAKAKYLHENKIPLKTVSIDVLGLFDGDPKSTYKYHIMQDGTVVQEKSSGKLVAVTNKNLNSYEKLVNHAKANGLEAKVTNYNSKKQQPKKIDDPDGKKKEPKKQPEKNPEPTKKPEGDGKQHEIDPNGAPKKFAYNDKAGALAYAEEDYKRYDFTSGEKYAITKYTGSSYSEINSSLRKGGNGGAYEKETADLTAACEKSSIKEPTMVYRGLGGNAVDYYLNAAGVSKVDGLIGAQLTDKGFWSTSLNEGVAQNFSGGVVLEITLPKGAKGVMPNGTSNYTRECEVILQRGSAVKITGTRVEHGYTYLQAEYVS